MSASDKKKLRKEQVAAQLTERQRREQAEEKKLKAFSVAFVAIMLVVALTTVGILGVRAINNSGIIDRNTLAATTGKHELNSVQVNYYLVDQIRTIYQQWETTYGESASIYASMMGLNINKPLNKQSNPSEEGETWADHFLHEALNKAKSDYALYDKAMAEGFTLSEDEQKELDSVSAQLDFYALYSGFKTSDKYLRSVYGFGADVESYLQYTKVATIASAYFAKYQQSLSYDDATIRAYEKDHFNDFSSFSYASYYLSTSTFLIGGTTDESGNKTYSDEEKAASVKAAEDVANSLLGAKDLVELDTAIAALEINKDKENVTSTKNSLVLYTQLPEALQAWLADENRVANEIGIVPNESVSTDAEGKETKTVLGYYVVLFQSRNDNLEPLANVRHLLIKFKGGTTDSSGNTVYSDAEKATAKAEAEKLLQQWKDGAATEESFIELVKEHSQDTSAADGGLFEDIHRESNYVPSFLAWSTNIDRKTGDTDVLISDYGYHVMYYVGDDEMNYRDYMISETLRAEDAEKWYNAIYDAATITAEKTNRLNLDYIIGSVF